MATPKALTLASMRPVALLALLWLLPAPLPAATADFDGSGIVDFSDFLQFASAFGSHQSVYDLNGDGTVNFGDFVTFASRFGTDGLIFTLRTPFQAAYYTETLAATPLDTSNLQLAIPERDSNLVWDLTVDKSYNAEQWERFDTQWTTLIHYSDQALRDRNITAAQHLHDYFLLLARNDAFYDARECVASETAYHHIGGYQRSLVTAGMAVSYMKLGNFAPATPSEAIEIRDWFERLLSCSRVRGEDLFKAVTDHNRETDEGPHNQIYPALFAWLTCAMVVQDEPVFQDALDHLAQTLTWIDPDGTSRAEVQQKQEQTWHYHVLNANFSVTMAILSELNDRPFIENTDLNRLVDVVLDAAVDSERLFFKQVSGGFDQADALAQTWDWSWVVHLQRYRSDTRIDDLVSTHNGKLLFHQHTGGNPYLWWPELPASE